MANKEAVWDVYDNYRTARLNVKYYSARLQKYERINTVVEILLAVAAPGSVISGLWFLDTQTGETFWKVLSALAAIVAFGAPFFKLGNKIKFFEQTLSGYRGVEFDLYEIVLKIREEGKYTAQAKAMCEAAMKKMKTLVTNPPENVPDKKLIESCFAEVNSEIPTSTFYVPEETANGNDTAS